jgi:hypothetical protein
MKILKPVLLSLVIFFVGQWIVVQVIDAVISKSSFRYSQLFSDNALLDHKVVCIGNSRGLNSFYTPYVNKTYDVDSYNLSFNGLRMPMMEIFIDEYISKNSDLEHAFIEVTNIIDPDTLVRYSAFNIYSNKSKVIQDKIFETDAQRYWTTKFFPLYRYNTEKLFRILYYVLKPTDQDWINRYRIPITLEAEIESLEQQYFQIHQEDLISLSRVIKKLENQDVKVVLFVAPYLPRYLDKVSNLDAVITEIETQTNKAIIDLSDFVQNTELFADRVHTNEGGAEIISDTLMHLIR